MNQVFSSYNPFLTLEYMQRKSITPEIWQQLDELEKSILTYLGSKKKVTRSELCTYTSKAPNTISARLNHLISINIIKRNGSKYDPKQTYEMQ